MSFDLSALTAYVDQNSKDLILPLHFEGQTAQNVTLKGGVKYKEALQLFQVNAVPQDGNGCGFNATGDGVFSQREIEVKKIKYQNQWCMDDLLEYWTQTLLVPGSTEEDRQMTFQRAVVQELVGQIVENNEYADWRGDTTSADAALSRYDGFLKIIDAAGTAQSGNTSGLSSITGGASGNADTVVFEMCDARPAKLKSPTRQTLLFCGLDTYQKFLDKLLRSNLYHVDVSAQGDEFMMKVPGRTNVTLIGTNGLTGTDRLILAEKRNLVIGFDLANDHEQFYLEYSFRDQILYSSIKYKRGVQVAYPDEIVEWTAA